MIAIDVVDKLPRSHDGKFFILTIIDHYSRYLNAIALPNITTHTIIKNLSDYFSRYGIPKIILSDNATNFCSNDFEDFLKSLNIEHRRTSIYFPRSNGVVERINRSLKESVASLSDQVIEWSDRLKFFVLHYNNVRHSITNFTPSQLFMGRELNLPLDIYHPPKNVDEPSIYVQKQLEHFKETQKIVQRNEENYFEKREKFLKGGPTRNFEIDDIVYMKSLISPSTFMPKYEGPFVVLRKIRNGNYLIKHTDQENAKIIKINGSKLYKKISEQTNE